MNTIMQDNKLDTNFRATNSGKNPAISSGRWMILLLIFLLPFQLLAQQAFQWGIRAGSKGDDRVNDVICIDNDIYLTGKFPGKFTVGEEEAEGNGMIDAFFLCLNENGKPKWLNTIGGPSVDYATCLARGKNSILMAGVLTDQVKFGKQTFEGNGPSVFVASWTDKGKLNWLSRIPFAGHATVDFLEQTNDGTIRIGGQFQGSFSTGDELLVSPDDKRAYAINLTEKGGYLDARKSLGKNNHRLLNAKFDKEYNELLLFSSSGSLEFSKKGNANELTENLPGLVIQQNDANGQMKWIRNLRGEGYTDAAGIAIGDDGFYLAANFNRDLLIGDTLLTTNAQSATCLAWFGKDGKLGWVKVLESPVSCRAIDVMITPTGNALITGYFRESYSVEKQTYTSEQNMENVFLAQFDQQGKLIWHDEPGTKAASFGKAFALDMKGNIIFSGGFRNKMRLDDKEISAEGEEDILIAKYLNCEQLELDIKGDLVLCDGSETTLRATPGYDAYFWNDLYTNSPNFRINKPGTYTLRAYGKKGCAAMDTLVVGTAPVYELTLGPDTILRPGQEFELEASPGFASYTWSDGFIGQYRTVKYSATLDSVKYFIDCKTTEGCAYRDSVTVSFAPAEKGVMGLNRNFRLNLYPNPAHEYFSWWITADSKFEAVAQITDEKGSKVKAWSLQEYHPGNENRVKVSDLTPAVYLFRVTIKLNGEELVLNEKLVVQ